ncbi:hypothetical protein [Caulobacter sp.]|uniref:hypothetical protein n=1 Tax=Caulobacter sp. TaxID=78 RepID=UPI003BAAA829
MRSHRRPGLHQGALLAALLVAAATPALAQMQVQSLAPPDLFSTPAGPTDLGGDLWKDTAPGIARDVLPRLAARPLSPAFADLARKVLATGANGPVGVGNEPDMGAARALGLIALGDAAGADLVLDRAPGVANNAALSLASAEAALIKGDDDKACRIGEALTVDRGAGYWLRLRAFCQARAGQVDAAQLTLSLVQQQAPQQQAQKGGGGDADYVRLMSAVAAGTPPGAANLRNGINYALSRKLGLDLAAAAATASPAVSRMITPPGPPPPPAGLDLTAAETSDLAFLRQAKGLVAFIDAAKASAASIAALARADAPLRDPVLFARAALVAGDLPTAQAIRSRLVQDQIPGATATDLALLDAMISAASGKPDGQVLARLIDRGAQGGAKSPAQAAALLLASLGGAMGPDERAQFATFDVGRPTASAPRLALLDAAADRKGEAALLALSIAAEAGVAGPSAVDRARIAQGLARAGLAADARAVVVEGLLALTLPTK